MAKREIVVELQLSDTNAVAELGRLEIETKQYQRELKALNAEIAKNGQATRQQQEAVGTLNASIRRNQTVIRELKNDLSGATAAGLRFRDKMAEASRAGLGAFGLSAVGVAGAVTGLVSVFKQAINAAEEQRQALAALDQAIKTTGAAAGFTSDQLAKMATELQKTTLFGDEEILRGVSLQLLTFTNIAGEEFARAQKAALDLSTVLGTDLQSSAIQVGKALNDPITGLTALRKVGVSFTADQKELIRSLAETGHTAEAQRIILAELERQYGGQAEAMAAASNGAKQLGNAWGDLLEVLGDSSWIRKFNGFLQTAIEGLTLLVSKSNELLGGDIGDGEGSWLRERNSIAAFTEEADKYLSARERMILQDRDVRNSAVRNFQEQARATIEFEKRTGGLIELQQEWRKELLAAEPGSRKYAFLMVALKQLSTEVAVAEKEKAVSTEKASKSTSTSVGALRERLSALKEERDALSINDKEGLAANAASIVALEKQIAALDASTKATTKKSEAVRKLTADQLAQLDAENNVRSDALGNIFAQTGDGTTTPAVELQKEEEAELDSIVEQGLANRNALREEARLREISGIVDLNAERSLLEAEWQSGSIASYEEYAERKAAIDTAMKYQQMQALGATADIFGSLASLYDEASEEHKAFATIQTLINTYMSATQAYNALVGIPYVGPYLATVAAAAAVAAGLANVAKIQGFEEGGYTSKRRRDDEPVGVVHANEYVVPAPIVRNPRGKRLIDELERMRMGHPVRYAPPFIGGGIGTNNNVRFVRGTGLAQTGITAADVATADLSRAIMSMPAPVVRVDEINRVQRRVNVIESISRT